MKDSSKVKSMDVVPIGLVGCGGIANQLHLPVLSAMSDVFRLCAACDTDEDRAREVGEEYGVPWYTSLDEMLEAQPDMSAVDICTWMWTHQLVATKVARAGKHIIIEKPLALTLPWADEILEAVNEGGVYLEVAENYPRWPNDRVIQQIVRQGGIGELIYIYSRTALHPFAVDFNIHRMAQMRAVVGSSVERVTAVMRPQSALPLPEQGLHEFGDPRSRHWGIAAIDFASGALGVVDGPPRGCASGEGSARRIIGTDGTILSDSLYQARNEDVAWAAHQRSVPIERVSAQNGTPMLEKIIVHTDQPIIWENPYLHYSFPEGSASWACWQVAMADAYMSLYRAISTGQEPEWNGPRARRDLELCVATFESYLQAMPIELPLRAVTQYEDSILESYEERFGAGKPVAT